MIDLVTTVIVPAIGAGLGYLALIALGAWVAQRLGYFPKGYRERLRRSQVAQFNAHPGGWPGGWQVQARTALEDARELVARAAAGQGGTADEFRRVQSCVATALVSMKLDEVHPVGLAASGLSKGPVLPAGQALHGALVAAPLPLGTRDVEHAKALREGLHTMERQLQLLERDLSQPSAHKAST